MLTIEHWWDRAGKLKGIRQLGEVLDHEKNTQKGDWRLGMACRLIQVGTGGFGGMWCKEWLPRFVANGLIEVVAAVDINQEALENPRKHLGLSDDQCYTDAKKAFDENEADFSTVVVPPGFHEDIVDLALAHDMHILSEKPIASDLPTSVRIANKVKAAGKKMGVTMSHRFDQDKTSLREALRSGKYGSLDYIVAHHTCELRRSPTWGRFRYEISDVQQIEGGVHYLDILADLAGARCEEIYAQSWNPKWSEFAGDPQNLVVMRFENGTRAMYEAAATNAVGLYPWQNESWRAECEHATLSLDHRELEVFTHDATKNGVRKRLGEGEDIPLSERPNFGHHWLIEKFLDWLDGGEPMETNVEDNLQSVALFSAGIESGRTGKPVRVQDLLAQARKEVEA